MFGLSRQEPFAVRPESIAAVQFNAIRLALTRFGEPLTETLWRRGFVAEFEASRWRIFDRRLGGAPLIVYVRFDSRDRYRLDQPVCCDAIEYHRYARALAPNLLEDFSRRLHLRLRPPARSAVMGSLVPLHTPSHTHEV